MKYIIMGRKIKIDYHLSTLNETLFEQNYYQISWNNPIPIVASSEKVIDDSVIIFEGYMDDEYVLEVGEYIFIGNVDKNKTAEVLKVAKNTDGGFVYYTDYVVSVEDHEHEKIKLQHQLEITKQKEESEKRINKLEQELKETRNEVSKLEQELFFRNKPLEKSFFSKIFNRKEK